MVIASKGIRVQIVAHCLISYPVIASFVAMTIAKVVSDGYNTPKRLKDLKTISPLIVSMVQDGALYYTLYVTPHLLVSSCSQYVPRMIGVFTCHSRRSQLLIHTLDPAILLITIILLETTQGFLSTISMPCVFVLNIFSSFYLNPSELDGWLPCMR